MCKIISCRLSRPFQGAHWLLPVILVVAWVFVSVTPCKEPPYYFEASLVTASIFLSLWVSHLRASSEPDWRRIVSVAGGALYDLLTIFILSIFVVLAITIVSPIYDCYTPRAKVTEMILTASALRGDIDAHFVQNKTLRDSGLGLVVHPSGRTKAGLVTNDGTIIAIGEDPPAVVLLQPTVIQGQISWRCQGFPAKIMPNVCR